MSANNYLVIYQDDPSDTVTYILAQFFTKSTVANFRFSKILDGLVIKDFLFSDFNSVFVSRLMTDSTSSTSACHPNCGLNACALQNKFGNFRF
jgi:hypothetical protein